MSKVFGYPEFDESGEMIVTEYDGDYAAMLMDIRVYKMKTGETRKFCRPGEEIAVLLFNGTITFAWEDQRETVHRDGVFIDGPWCVHASSGVEIAVTAETEAELLVQCTKNEKDFPSRLYRPEDAPWKYSGVGKFGDVARRRVNTIFDHDICPESNMVLGEILNDKGNWSGYLPHRHPQQEVYFFLFDHPEGFGASFVGDEVYKSVDHSFSAIPGGDLHPQAVAPGFEMFTVWMIRHFDGNPWLQTDRCEDERYIWLHDAKF
jgi:5-deoxy-glucuronate isomerase